MPPTDPQTTPPGRNPTPTLDEVVERAATCLAEGVDPCTLRPVVDELVRLRKVLLGRLPTPTDPYRAVTSKSVLDRLLLVTGALDVVRDYVVCWEEDRGEDTLPVDHDLDRVG